MPASVPNRGAVCVAVVALVLVVSSSAPLSARALLALDAVARLLARLLRYALFATVAPLIVAWLFEWRSRRAGRGNARGPCGEAERRTSLSSTIQYSRKAVQPFYFTSPAAWSVTQTRAKWEATARSGPRPLLSTPPAHPAADPGGHAVFETALDSLLHLITRDFVEKWYSSFSDSPGFPVAVESTIRQVLVTVSARTAKIDWAEVLVSRIAPLLSTHLERCRAAEKAVHGRDAGKAPPPDSDEADLLLAGKYAAATPSRKLHPAVDVASPNSRPAEEAWLRGLVESILPLVLPEHEHASPAVRIMIREIVACAVLIPVFETMCDPDFWNRLIEDKASAAIRDQRMVSQFRQALDEGAAIASAGKRSFTAPGKIESGPDRTRSLEVISVRTSGRQFDAWLKGINRCATVADAKRLRSDVSAQIRRAKTLTEGRKNDELVEGISVTQWIDFIERLYAAKRKIDKRISKLGGDAAGFRRAPSIYHLAAADSTMSFRDILLDPSAVTYAMEYLERRKHASRAVFWLAVEGTKDPLDDIVDDDLVVTTSKTAELQTRAFLDDVKMIWEAYLAADPFRSNPTHLQTIEAFATAKDPATAEFAPVDVRTLRHALFAVQHGVLALLQEEDLPGFVRSDLYFKALSSLAPAAKMGPAGLEQSPLPSEAMPPSPRASTPPAKLGAQLARTAPALPARPDSARLETANALAPFESQPKAESRRSPSPNPSPILARTELLVVRESAPPQISRAHAVIGEQTSTADADSTPPSPGPSRAGRHPSLSRIDEGVDSERQNSLSFLIDAPVEGADDATRRPLFAGGEVDGLELDDEDFIEIRTIDAIQDALSSILESADAQSTRPLHSSAASLPDRGGAPIGRRLSGEHARSKSASAITTLAAAAGSTSSGSPKLPLSPTVSSADLPTSTASRARRVFDDPETYADPTDDSLPSPDILDVASILTTATLPELERQTSRLREQGVVVDALIRRAELTGNVAELKLLGRSRQMLERELQAMSYRRAQLENDTKNERTAFSAGRTRLSIPGTSVGQVSGLGSQTFQLFLVRVLQQAGRDGSDFEWIVPRRYSEFASLNDRLREQHAPARALDFPSKRLVGTWSKEFIEQRRLGLERYLQALLDIPEVSSDAQFTDFLSRQSIAVPVPDERKKRTGAATPALVRNLYRGFTSGIDDVLGTSTTSLLDTVVDRLTAQASDLADQASLGLKIDDLAGSFPAGIAAGTARGEELSSFTAPICDLFLTAFDLREDWIRRQAILIVLQQVLGGTIERKLRDAVANLISPFQLAGYIDALRGSLWPNGQRRPPGEQRSKEQRTSSRDAAISCLSTLMPEFAANLIGRHNAKWGARRLFAAVQSKRLNKHLMFSIVDEALHLIFPEL